MPWRKSNTAVDYNAVDYDNESVVSVSYSDISDLTGDLLHNSVIFIFI